MVAKSIGPAQKNEDFFIKKSSSSLQSFLEPIIIVDAMNSIHKYDRNFQHLTTKAGVQTGVIYGFIKLLTTWRSNNPGTFILAWDEQPTKQREVYSEYKSNRSPKREAFYEQVNILKQLTEALGVAQSYAPEREADEVIGTLVLKTFKEKQCIILSQDMDFYQLVSNRTLVIKPKSSSKEQKIITEKEVQERFKVTPIFVPLFRAVTGDVSDGVKGVPFINKGRLSQAILLYQNVEDLVKDPHNIFRSKEKERLLSGKDIIYRNLQLMHLKPIENVFVYKKPFNEKMVYDTFQKFEMISFLSQWEKFKEVWMHRSV